jgi:RecJ-like exonuclease
MRKFVLSERQIPCPSCNGEGLQNYMGYADCIDCDGEGLIQDEFWDGDFVKHRNQDLQGWIVGFDGCKAIVEINDDDEEEETRLIYRLEELEHAKEG